MGSPLAVVVVDDDVNTANGFCHAIGALGHKCVVAHDGASALGLIERNHADVVVSDLTMPGIDGLELCRAVRVRKDRYVYFVLVSGAGDKQHVMDAMRAGVDDYLTKPIDLDALEARMVCAERVVGVHRALLSRNKSCAATASGYLEVSRVDALTGARNRRALAEDLHRDPRRAHPLRRTVRGRDVRRRPLQGLQRRPRPPRGRRGAQVDRSDHRARAPSRRRHLSLRRRGDSSCSCHSRASPSATAATERIRRQVARMTPVTISVGVSELLAEDADEDACIRRADVALYRAKSAGRNRVVA